MCGINGMVFLGGVKRSEEVLDQIRFVFNELMVQTEARGHHAAGIVHTRRDGFYEYYKKGISPTQMATYDETYLDIIQGLDDETSSIIGHTRYYTKGKPDNNHNNHPFDIGEVVGVHNGTIDNDDYLFKQYKKHFKRIGEVDSEIIYQLINHYNKHEITLDGLKKALVSTYLRGYFALAFMHKNQPNLVHIVKQERPLVLGFWKEAGVIIFNSQEDLIRNVFNQLRRMSNILGYDCSFTVTYEELKDNVYLTLDSSAEVLEEMVSAKEEIKIATPFSRSKSYGNANTNWRERYGTSTNTGTSPAEVLSRTLLEAKDSMGRVIEGELDPVTGEIVLNLSALLDKEKEEEEVCVECREKLSDAAKLASYNDHNPKGSRVCAKCYQAAMESIVGGVVK